MSKQCSKGEVYKVCPVFQVYQLLHGETYYKAFIQSEVYEKLLDDLGFNDASLPDGDNLSLDDGNYFVYLHYLLSHSPLF